MTSCETEAEVTSHSQVTGDDLTNVDTVVAGDDRMSADALLHRSLLDGRFEVLPLRGVFEQVQSLPAGSTVTVTSSPTKGTGASVDLAVRLAGEGFHVVPHLAARMITGRAELSDILDRLDAGGLSEVFVVAGDAEIPAGDFPDALALLRGMEELGRKPERVGITGYPERHAFIADHWTIKAMAEKARYADYIVSQICYDPLVTGEWVAAVRQRGVSLPVYVGVPGVVDGTKLLRVSLKIGLGDSMRFLRKSGGALAKLLTRYTPEDLVTGLAGYLSDPELNIAGWHFFTFNEIARTDRWRQDFAARLEGVVA